MKLARIACHAELLQHFSAIIRETGWSPLLRIRWVPITVQWFRRGLSLEEVNLEVESHVDYAALTDPFGRYGVAVGTSIPGL